MIMLIDRGGGMWCFGSAHLLSGGVVTTWQCPSPLKKGACDDLAAPISPRGACNDLVAPISSQGGTCDDLTVPISSPSVFELGYM